MCSKGRTYVLRVISDSYFLSVECLTSILRLLVFCFYSIINLILEINPFLQKQYMCVYVYVCIYLASYLSIFECMSDFTPGFGKAHRDLYIRSSKSLTLNIVYHSPFMTSSLSFLLFSHFFFTCHSDGSHSYIPLTLMPGSFNCFFCFLYSC